MHSALPPHSAGLGLRRALLDPLIEAPAGAFDFLECTPDHWIGVGGMLGEQLATLTSRYPLSCHGLSLSLGGPDPLDIAFLQQTRHFLDRHHAVLYSEHLSYCSAGGHLYDLLPLPFTEEAVHHTAARIRTAQDVPVSYTHLDVYKRQGHGGDKRARIVVVIDSVDIHVVDVQQKIAIGLTQHGGNEVDFRKLLIGRGVVAHVFHRDAPAQHILRGTDARSGVVHRFFGKWQRQ